MPARASMAGPDASPSMQSPWNGQTPANVSPGLAHDADVAELGVIHAEHRAATHDGAHADAGTHGDIREVVEARGAAPQRPSASAAPLTSVSKPTGTPTPAEPLADVGVAPAGLGRRGDVTPGGRTGAQIDGPERRDAERARAPYCARQRSSTASICRSVSSRSPVGRRSMARTSSGPGAENAHALGAAQLDTGE